MPAPHPALQPLAFLLGEWRGSGRGEWPTTEPFRYEEEMAFTHVGEPWLQYAQRAFGPGDGVTIHAEVGFWRPLEDGTLDVVLAHPLGVAEVTEGAVDGRAVRLLSSVVARGRHGEAVRHLERRIDVEGDVLRYELLMETDTVSLRRHLSGELRRA
jgi:hypothetical protein